MYVMNKSIPPEIQKELIINHHNKVLASYENKMKKLNRKRNSEKNSIFVQSMLKTF